jgi:hypothetical protein
MATAPGEPKATRSPVMPFVAYAVVLASVGWAGVAFWMSGKGNLPGRAAPAVSMAAPTEPVPPAGGLKLPPRPTPPEAAAPAAPKPAPAPLPLRSSPGEASTTDPAAAPPKTTCTIDVGPWPTDKTEQGKAIQGLLRALGLYDGTVYGTVGPMTRAAIRKFQASAGQAETGDPDERLFESLKKKCASPAP